ncbi:hypothetical protein BKA82DRAFT_138465 [Pisolithus tinctorius]|uniref:Uncharacterized protein n=1 Tax=Pisolithus tinctorius Marx 270 TaxID=870435 RepID=A0A0C3PFM0_PISTI|nr:hypothetical protein BKA82DRAFT_138465 [Pisolithus tinctorius]KIO06719.1 hypothetical protein M404DRAFT_138465 [Pisolithus tinctorius Marx 270]
MPLTPSHTGEDSKIYSDPEFRNAFEHAPNRCSDKALALYLLWRGFQENCSQSTIDGKYLQHAFLSNSDGAMFYGNWHHNHVHHQWEGNPVFSAEVEDIVASIRHKVNSKGAEWKHSGAMKKEYMNKILAWSGLLCPLDTPLQYIHLSMVGCKMLPSGKSLSRKVRLAVTWHLEHLAFGTVAFTLWTR